MFDAARSLLAPHPVDPKTHRGVLQLFSEKFVKTGVIPVEAGRSLKRAETSRYIADYEGQGLHLPEAAALVREAEEFVSLVQQVHAQGSAAP